MLPLLETDIFLWRKLSLCLNAIFIPKKVALVHLPQLSASLWSSRVFKIGGFCSKSLVPLWFFKIQRILCFLSQNVKAVQEISVYEKSTIKREEKWQLSFRECIWEEEMDGTIFWKLSFINYLVFVYHFCAVQCSLWWGSVAFWHYFFCKIWGLKWVFCRIQFEEII